MAFDSRHFRSFSLRSLMVFVTASAVLAWAWAIYQDRQTARVAIALAAIGRENPDARIRYVRDKGELSVYVTGARRITAATARLLSRAELIRMIQISARDDDGMLETPAYGRESLRMLEAGFGRVQLDMGKVVCSRSEQKPLAKGVLVEWQPSSSVR